MLKLNGSLKTRDPVLVGKGSGKRAGQPPRLFCEVPLGITARTLLSQLEE